MQPRPQPRRPRGRSRVLHATALIVAACASLLTVLVFAHVSAPTAVATSARPLSPRALPVEHVAAGIGAQARAASHATHSGGSPSSGCQVNVHVSQTSSNGSIQQTSSSSTSGSCSACVVSVQSTQSSANGSNISVSQTTTQSCSSTNSQSGNGVHISQNGNSISVQSGGTSVHVSRNGGSISISVGP